MVEAAVLNPYRTRRGPVALLGASLVVAVASLGYSLSNSSPRADEVGEARPGVTSSQLSCNGLSAAESMTTELVTLPPLALAPSHVHGGSVFAYVLHGSVRSQLNGGAIATFATGQTWFEPRGTLHDFLENASPTETAEILAVYVAGNCEPLTTYL